MRPSNPITVSRALAEGFDAIIDARSPAEFAEDHIPGAVSCPVLDDAERARVGTLYKQVSAFEARKVGAALVARNIARHIEERFSAMPKGWRPLVYCWRGGQRSGAMEIILGQVGWNVARLEGGYKAYRQHVVQELSALVERQRFYVVNGLTGSGKTALLRVLEQKGAQVLDLEGAAAHRGSLLGNLQDTPQPSRKMLESRLWDKLRGFDPARPVFIEAESRKIGAVELPPVLCLAMHRSPCATVDVPVEARVDWLLADYADLTARKDWLLGRLSALKELQGKETVLRWIGWAEAEDWRPLARELLTLHYDPRYRKSMQRNYPRMGDSPALRMDAVTPENLSRLADELTAQAAQ